MATLKFYELKNEKWENAKTGERRSKLYFTHVLRGRWGIEKAIPSSGNAFWALSDNAKPPSSLGRPRLLSWPLSFNYFAPANAKKQNWVEKAIFVCEFQISLILSILGKQNRGIPD